MQIDAATMDRYLACDAPVEPKQSNKNRQAFPENTESFWFSGFLHLTAFNRERHLLVLFVRVGALLLGKKIINQIAKRNRPGTGSPRDNFACVSIWSAGTGNET